MFKRFEKKEEYLIAYLESYSKEKNEITKLANISALLNYYFENINWVGFYILKQNTLHLGPFQGLPACTNIEVPNGVCGTCIKENKIQVIKNVKEIKNHITCDEASVSEIVIPLYKNNKIYGVLDVDSNSENNFGKDIKLFEKIGQIISVGLTNET